MSVVEIVDHPLIQHKISLLRDRNTGTKEFRDLVSEIAMLLCYEATRDLPTEEVEVETPVALARTKVLAGRKLALVPILRAGLGMVDGMLNLIPAAKVGHIGMYRNEETLEPVEYYCKLPNDINEREVLSWIRCWLPAAAPATPSARSRSAVPSTSSSSVWLLPLRV